VNFGHFFLPNYFADADGDMGGYLRFLVDFAIESEDLGYDSVWANEHHFAPYGGLLPAVPLFLTAVAQRTSRVRLGTSIVVLSLHSPIEVAEQVAMLDLLSNGRVEFGVGRGYSPLDFEGLGLDPAEAQELTLEGLAVILAAWQPGPFDHEGRHYRFRNLDVWPKVQQQPHPPVWMACSRTPASFEGAARAGHRLLTIAHVNPIPDLAALTRTYRQAWAEAGRDPAGCYIGSHFHIYVDEDSRQGQELAVEYFGRSMRQSAPTFPTTTRFYETKAEQHLAEGRIVGGNPDDVVEALSRLQDELGFTEFNGKFIFGGMPRERARASLRLFAREVIPALRPRQPAWAGAGQDK
jgi:alkanesulfonate monooxygenase SsuD/methylene tetrahydromethanopterin reductase-like flavin-dependent oxidoreductase (luciferase family)